MGDFNTAIPANGKAWVLREMQNTGLGKGFGDMVLTDI